MQTFISFEEARRLVLDRVPALPAEQVALDDALGRVLADDVHSTEDVPAFDNSAMDGFAVRAADLSSLPAQLRVQEDVPAGHAPQATVEPGTCAQIMTGAPVPEGADTIVPVEKTERDGAVVTIAEAPPEGTHVRRAGKDLQKGDRLFEAGTPVTPPVVGVLAMVGCEAVRAARVPRVAVVTTGDELVDVGAPLAPGQIRDANQPALAAQVRAAGARPGPLRRAADSEAALEAAVADAQADADVLLLAGGMSAGEYDYVRPVLRAMGMEWVFWRVQQRPGRPFGFGLLDGTPVFGLPGNPTTAAVCFEMHVRPALARIAGRQPAVRPRFPAVLDAPVDKPAGLHYLSRATAAPGDDGRLHVRTQGPQSSGFYVPMARANCILHLPQGLENPPAGTPVEIEWLAWSPSTSS